MTRQRMEYKVVRSKMNPGDVIAFSGKDPLSEIIRWATRASVSHIGVVLRSRLVINNEPQKGYFNQIIESTSLNGFSGISFSRLSDLIATYDGEIWWLPLGDTVRNKLDLKKFYDFLIHQEHRPYDMPQAIKSALDAFDTTPLLSGLGSSTNIEGFSKHFSSELVAAGLEAGGAIGSLNASAVTPISLCMFNIYQLSYYQLKGADKDIEAYNTVSPEGWGE